jgi:hypothetical protein
LRKREEIKIPCAMKGYSRDDIISNQKIRQELQMFAVWQKRKEGLDEWFWPRPYINSIVPTKERESSENQGRDRAQVR